MNAIFNEDCRTTMRRWGKYDYVFTSPPDYVELGLHPVNDKLLYLQFLRGVFFGLAPTSGAITVVMTSRRFSGRIIPKHHMMAEVMTEKGYHLVGEKVWAKSLNTSLYRPNSAYIQCFSNGKAKQNRPPEYGPDVWLLKPERYGGFKYGMPVELAKRCILNFTQPGERVYDPFMGSGTTAVAAVETEREYTGSEIDTATYTLAQGRLAALATQEELPWGEPGEEAHGGSTDPA